MWTYALALISAVLGGWMLADGLRVLRTGRYFGPETPGPWRHVPQAFGVDPFALGPVFVGLGAAWLIAAAMHLTLGLPRPAVVVLAILTLWYLPVGTVLSLAVLAILWLAV